MTRSIKQRPVNRKPQQILSSRIQERKIKGMAHLSLLYYLNTQRRHDNREKRWNESWRCSLSFSDTNPYVRLDFRARRIYSTSRSHLNLLIRTAGSISYFPSFLSWQTTGLSISQNVYPLSGLSKASAFFNTGHFIENVYDMRTTK